ncbi:hypothetical protein [Hydrococcus rivularis]|nr:hypothetical protein [Hydrococcus rivularis]
MRLFWSIRNSSDRSRNIRYLSRSHCQDLLFDGRLIAIALSV